MPEQSWNQPRCEACWCEMEGQWDGNQLVALPEPVRLRSEAFIVEQCAWCGGPTFAGIYVRSNPALVPFPATKDED